MFPRLLVLILICMGAPAAARAQTLPDVTVVDRLAEGGLHLSVFAAPFRGWEGTESVLVGVEVRGLRPGGAGEEGRPRRLDVLYSAAADATPVVDQAIAVALDGLAGLGPDQPVRALTRLAVPPGTFRLTVTVRDSHDGRMSAATHDLEVPPFIQQADAVAISGLLLTSSAADGVTHADPAEEYGLLPVLLQPPAARRRFSRAERVEVIVEIYERDVEFDFFSQLSVFTQVLDSNGDVVFSTSDLGTSEALWDGRWGYQHYALVPVRDLAPGSYVLRVGAVYDDTSGDAWRSVPFTVVD